MMKVLFLVHQFFPKSYMGTERFTLDLAKQAQRMGYNPRVLTYDRSPDRKQFEKLTDNVLVRHYRYAGIPVTAVHSRIADAIEIFDHSVATAVDMLKLDCDIVHISHPMWVASVARALKQVRGIPVVMTLTDSWLLCPRGLLDLGCRLCNGPEAGARCIRCCRFSSKIKSRYEDAKTLFDMADEVVVASRFVANLFIQNGWNRKTRIVPHGIDYSNVQVAECHERSRLTLGFIGSIAWHKGLHVLVKAFRKVPDDDLRLRIHGSESESSDYYREVLALARPDSRISFLGPFQIDRLPDVMRDISALVIPSTYYEPYPLVMLISLAYNVPVIASNIGGIPEVIRDGINGLTFEPGNVDDLVRVIRQLADRPQILQMLRSNITAPRRTEEEALDYDNIYRNLKPA